ncbi:acyl-CoA thioester hydrolase YciA, partial [Pseudomonas aeruginosa]|nr:acyl-CoA thioester hydrolase YciA [Pseudomonas aeruginosa]
MSQMDIGGAIMAKEIAQGRVVTVRVDGMTFLRPVAVGDVVCCYARCVKRGNTSVTINIEVWVKKVSSEPIGQRYKAIGNSMAVPCMAWLGNRLVQCLHKT